METKYGKRRLKYKKFYTFTYFLQKFLWKIGIPWHNSFSDECTPNFNCCKNLSKVKTNKMNKLALARYFIEIIFIMLCIVVFLGFFWSMLLIAGVLKYD